MTEETKKTYNMPVSGPPDNVEQYQFERANNYPSIKYQLDLIYHQGLDAWKAEIKQIKDKFPKPE